MAGRLTTAAGAPVADDQTSLTAGPRGPILLQDGHLIEKLAHHNRERIPERVVHAKGCGAHGTLTVTGDLTRYTRAAVLQPGARTELIARFSTVAGELGAADAERDLRGFAVKFYTPEGNWDLVGNNSPVFYVRDPLKFPDLVRSQKRHPRSNLRSPAAMWDFLSLSPEALHQVTILMSDRGLPAAPMFMNGYGGHTYGFWNVRGERFWVKFHLRTLQGHRHLTNAEAAAVIGRTRDSDQEALFGAIERGDFPKWRLQVQVMPEAAAAAAPFDPFDVTKVWPHRDYPPIDVGVLELDRNPDNHFAEIEQLAFSPGNFVPGIGPSPDRLLQARLFAYADAQRYRLGTHYGALPVNAPRCPVAHRHKDGAMRFFRHDGGHPDAYYAPSSLGGAAPEPAAAEPPLRLAGDAARHGRPAGADDFGQARALFALFEAGQRARLFANIAAALHGVPAATVARQCGLFDRVDAAYGAGVRAAVAARAAAG